MTLVQIKKKSASNVFCDSFLSVVALTNREAEKKLFFGGKSNKSRGGGVRGCPLRMK